MHREVRRGGNYRLPWRDSIDIQAASAQMSKVLIFTLSMVLAGSMAGCATHNKSGLAAVRTGIRRIEKVRTTAYTHTEGSGRHNAIGARLSGGDVISAAADWSRFPLGTKFRIVDTNEVFQIDDYGGALIGTNTIDLYKTNRLAMRRWGVRHVDIDILEWGSDERSLYVLAPRARNHLVRRMILALQEKARARSPLLNF
jgi:3D (Asp-Asp-Asp) domain-containing protein